MRCVTHRVIPTPGFEKELRPLLKRHRSLAKDLLKLEKELEQRQCLKRKIMPDEVARFTVFLASEEASACTNQHYVVDGGWI